MKIVILSQNENVYLPSSFATVCEQLGNRIAAIVALPPMSTHGGPVKGFLRHFNLFGPIGTAQMAWKVLSAKLLATISRPIASGPFYSVHGVASAFNVPFRNETSIESQSFQSMLDEIEPDLLISISCPQIIGPRVRERFPQGCINVHGAPLPRYRGLMPAFWALRNGETMTAVTVHDLEDQLDDGDIILQRDVEITTNDTWHSLVVRSKAAGAAALVETVLAIEAGTEQRQPNLESDATYFSFPTAEDRQVFHDLGRRFF